MGQIKNITSHHYTGMIRFIMVVILILVTLGGFSVAYQTMYADQIYPGVTLGGINLSKLSHEQARQLLQTNWDKLSQAGIIVSANNQEVALKGLVSSVADPDLTYELMGFDSGQATDEAFSIGRRGAWWQKIIEPIVARAIGFNIEPKFTLTMDRIKKFLSINLDQAEKKAKSANFVIQGDEVTVDPEQIGFLIDENYLRTELTERLRSFSNRPLALKFKAETPALSVHDLEPLVPELKKYLKPEAITLTTNDKKWVVPAEVWHQWWGAEKISGGAQIAFDESKAAAFFSDLKKEVDQPAREAKFEMKNGRVVVFEPSQLGRVVNVEAVLKQVRATILASTFAPVDLVISETEPSLITESVNNLGIREIIGVGRSNFAGSPKNRRTNIKVGAAALNGILIQPGEEFSLIKTLGSIDATSGYLQELVIKGDKTVPEFGGGLCQIGTTTFRAALASGLPIVERQNHSYRVAYYEPAGTDATIYDPKPDFKFSNDTGSAVLIQTKIQGDDLVFEFWGKKDGRTAQSTKPRIYNIVKPPDSKITETEDLPVGEKKCTEHAHAGADAEFTYTVTYVNGDKKEKVFKSHYVPWQEVCLVGVPKGSLSKPATGEVVLPSADVQGQSGN